MKIVFSGKSIKSGEEVSKEVIFDDDKFDISYNSTDDSSDLLIKDCIGDTNLIDSSWEFTKGTSLDGFKVEAYFFSNPLILRPQERNLIYKKGKSEYYKGIRFIVSKIKF